MNGMRGSIPRRKPKPPVERPPVIVNQIVAAPTFVDCGAITVPSNGSQRIFSWRFPSNGVVENASIELSNMPDGAGVVLTCMYGEQLVGSIPVEAAGVYRLGSIPVDDQNTVTVHLTNGNPDDVELSANISFVFKASNAKV